MTLDERYPTTLTYQPVRDQHWRVVEDEALYVSRMCEGALKHWPEEALREWLYRHADWIEDYGDLGFERFRFEHVTWHIDDIPGREAFRDEGFCDSFQDVEVRAAQKPHDWLAHFMLAEGTWNTPIILLHSAGRQTEAMESLKRPYHLLEGHRRLSFLQGLKRLGNARPTHAIWLVEIDDAVPCM
jgi:hypothetical protein